MKDYLNNLRPQEDALRRFSFVSYTEPMPNSVQCSHDDCNFEATKIEEMTNHQSDIRHPGWGSISSEQGKKSWVCGKCASRFVRWGILYVHLATHSLPYPCDQCDYKTGRLARFENNTAMFWTHQIDGLFKNQIFT